MMIDSGYWCASMEKSAARISEFRFHAVNWLLWAPGDSKTAYGKAMCITQNGPVDDADYAIIDCRQGVGLLKIHRHGIVRNGESFRIVGQTALIRQAGKVGDGSGGFC